MMNKEDFITELRNKMLSEYTKRYIDETNLDLEINKLLKAKDNLQQRIDKAIEYINKKWIEGSNIYSHFSAGCDCGNNFDFEEDREELLEILGGKE